MRDAFARLLRGLVLALLAVGVAGAAAAAERNVPRRALAPQEDPSGARVIVRFKALGALMRAQALGSGPQHAATMGRRLGLALTDGRVIDRQMQVLRGDKSLTSAQLAARLAADDEVEFAVPDLRRYALAAPNDPLYPSNAGNALPAGQWYLRAPDSTFVSAINAVGAWDLTLGSSSIVVADIDTGVLPSHPDLANKLVAGYDFIADTTYSGDNSARDADPTDPGDWTSAGECGVGSAAESSSWHGTQTSSIIGAQTNNGVGMASVGYSVKIQASRVLGKCGGVDSDILAAMLWAGGVSTVPYANPTPARVINLSLGSDGACNAAYVNAVSQLAAAGVVVVAAAGNDGLAVGTPANCSGVIAVAGLRHSGTKVGYSNLGPQIAVSAPAGNCVSNSGACLYPILTATNSGTTTAVSNTYSNATNYSVGTSFAAPMVAGTAALMLSLNPSLTVAQVTSMIKNSARAFPSASGVTNCVAPTGTAQDECVCTTATCGAGMLDVAAAVAAAAATAAPTASISASATTVNVGTDVTFNGGASTAPSGRTIASYAWALTSGNGVASFTSGTNAATATLATIAAGTFTVTLTVTDSAGATASTSKTVTVNVAGAPTVSLLASATTVSAGGSVTFDGRGSTASAGRTIATYAWSIVNGATLASFTSGTNAGTATVATAGNANGSFDVRLTVTDSTGAAASSTITVNVTPVGPTARITASATSIFSGGRVTFSGSGSTATTGRTIAGYQWTVIDGAALAAIVGGSTSSSLSIATSGAGPFTVELVVTDSAGAVSSATSTVVVRAASVSTSEDSGGSGGGAMSALWVGLLALAAACLQRAHRRERRLRR